MGFSAPSIYSQNEIKLSYFFLWSLNSKLSFFSLKIHRKRIKSVFPRVKINGRERQMTSAWRKVTFWKERGNIRSWKLFSWLCWFKIIRILFLYAFVIRITRSRMIQFDRYNFSSILRNSEPINVTHTMPHLFFRVFGAHCTVHSSIGTEHPLFVRSVSLFFEIKFGKYDLSAIFCRPGSFFIQSVPRLHSKWTQQPWSSRWLTKRIVRFASKETRAFDDFCSMVSSHIFVNRARWKHRKFLSVNIIL